MLDVYHHVHEHGPTMNKMIRKQIYISDSQETLLKERARALGITESALIRQGIDHAVRELRPVELDERAWQDALALMRERARIQSDKGARGWSREDVYDSRPGYLSR
jgi:hypothetical protein